MAVGRANGLLIVLRARFNKVPKRIENKIRKMTDLATLDSWVACAATCDSLDEFAEALK